jgi:hypothetical protein
MTNAELLDLLREALPFVETVKSDGVFGADGRASALFARIDAALAERQDSAQNAVEWRPSDQRVFLDNVSLRVVHHTDGLWVWSVYWPLSHRTEQGRAATEEEAKSAAIAAAKGMK